MKGNPLSEPGGFNNSYNFPNFNNFKKSSSFNANSPPDEQSNSNNIKKFTLDSMDSDQGELERLVSNKTLSLSPSNNMYRSISMYYDDPSNIFDEKQDKFKNEFLLSKVVEVNEEKVKDLKKDLYASLLKDTGDSNTNIISTNNTNVPVTASASASAEPPDYYKSKILSDLNVSKFLKSRPR